MSEKRILVAKGKAANIVAPSQLAINVGTDSGVQVGDSVTVRRESKVFDPDTHAELGVVYFIKVNLEVNYVQKNFSVAVVTDDAPTTTLAALAVTRISRVKRLTDNEREADSSTVFVAPGDPVLVRRMADDGSSVDGESDDEEEDGDEEDAE